MEQVYWVRHCKAEGQPPEARLTDLGWEQAKELGGFLVDRGIVRIVSSPFVRARESVVPLALRLGLEIEIDARFAERNVGDLGVDWDAEPEKAVATFSQTFDDLDLCFPEGESSQVAMDRAIAGVKDTLTGETPVVIASHGNLTTLMWKFYDASVGFAQWQALTNPDVLLLTFDGDTPTIERIWEG